MKLLNYEDNTLHNKTVLSIEIVENDIMIFIEDKEQGGKVNVHLLSALQAYEVGKALKTGSQYIQNKTKGG